MLKMIWCQDKNGGIGLNNKLPWRIKSEMQHFINETKGKAVAMGRGTYDSIGRALPNRENFVITRNNHIKIDGVKIINQPEEIINLAKDKDVYIIGGKSIYEYFLPHADELIISQLDNTYNCDCFLNLDLSNFVLTNEVKNPEFKVLYYKQRKNQH